MPTQITNRQIADGAIDNRTVKELANIDTSKLADGLNFLQRDGSVAMEQPLNMGGQIISNLNTPNTGTDATTKDYVDEQVQIHQDEYYVHTQILAASVWDINHNLGKKPTVVVVDSGDNVVLGDIEYVDNDNVLLTFTVDFGGKAYLN